MKPSQTKIYKWPIALALAAIACSHPGRPSLEEPFVKLYGGSEVEVHSKMIATTDGALLFTGWSGSVDGDFSLIDEPLGEDNIFLIKVDAQGLIK